MIHPLHFQEKASIQGLLGEPESLKQKTAQSISTNDRQAVSQPCQGYYSATKKHELLIRATVRTNLKSVMRSERSQTRVCLCKITEQFKVKKKCKCIFKKQVGSCLGRRGYPEGFGGCSYVNYLDCSSGFTGSHASPQAADTGRLLLVPGPPSPV